MFILVDAPVGTGIEDSTERGEAIAADWEISKICFLEMVVVFLAVNFLRLVSL
jgi:hypothetical protein